MHSPRYQLLPTTTLKERKGQKLRVQPKDSSFSLARLLATPTFPSPSTITYLFKKVGVIRDSTKSAIGSSFVPSLLVLHLHLLVRRNVCSFSLEFSVFTLILQNLPLSLPQASHFTITWSFGATMLLHGGQIFQCWLPFYWQLLLWEAFAGMSTRKQRHRSVGSQEA